MNLLAHALLSPPDVEIRLGNVLADFVKGRDRRSMPAAFMEGVRQHQRIDSFTDSHEIVSRSKARIKDRRHVTGILVDVFYDHFLTLNWDHYSSEPHAAFVARLYSEFAAHPIELPAHARAILDQIVSDDWLGSYGTVEGVDDTLCRIAERLAARIGTDLGLASGGSELVAHFNELKRDFAEFFPQLQSHVTNSFVTDLK